MDFLACIVVDLGSSGVQCSLWSKTTPFENCELSSEPERINLDDPEQIITAIERNLNQFIKKLRALKINFQNATLGFSSFGMNLLGLDENNNILSFSTYTGNLIYRGNKNKVNQISFNAEHQHTGVPKPGLACYAPAHISALRYSTIARFTTIISYCLEKWTSYSGTPISYSEASWWGIFNWREKDWHASAFRIIDISKLPKLCDYNEFSGALSEEYQRYWPELKFSKFLLGIVDGAAVTLGAAPGKNSVVVTVATSCAARIIVDRNEQYHRKIPDGCFCHVLDSSRVIIGGALSDGGIALDFTQKLLGIDRTTSDEIEKAVFPGKTIICLPFFSSAGERAPGWAGNLIPGGFVGINMDTTPLDLQVASIVGVALRLGEIGIPLMDTKPKIFISGSALTNSNAWKTAISGALRSDLWSINDDLQESVKRDNTTSRGIALLAFKKCIEEHRIHKVWRKPELSVLEKFDTLKELQRGVYQRLLNSLL